MKFILHRCLAALAPLVLMLATPLRADIACLKTNASKRLVKRVITSGSCPRGFIEIVNTTTLVGPTGPAGADGTNGANGADGADGEDGGFRLYGDGSDGALTISSGTTILSPNKQYTNVSVSGDTLTVKMGGIIRCTGTFTMTGGTLQALDGPVSGGVTSFSSGSVYLPSMRSPAPGISFAMPENGVIMNGFSASAGGGAGGYSYLFPSSITDLLRVGHSGGGGGAGGLDALSGNGGGALVVLCRQGIQIGASVTVAVTGNSGLSGGAGGGGGVVLLASSGTITFAGSINARGGAGSAATSSSGPGGGGGGGLVRFIAPTISDTGTVDVSGGLVPGAASSGTVTATIHSGGGGGGASAGYGGAGGTVATDGSASSATAGSAGVFEKTSKDPIGLLLY